LLDFKTSGVQRKILNVQIAKSPSVNYRYAQEKDTVIDKYILPEKLLNLRFFLLINFVSKHCNAKNNPA
jgi:hypothetical protein